MSRILDNPYRDVKDGRWIRGNLHVHPRPRENPSAAVQPYARLGYGFLGMTEHDHFYGPEEIRQWDRHGLVLLPGKEVTKNGPHVLQIGGDGRVEPDEDRQKVIDAIVAGGGFAVLNHPDIGPEFDHCPLDLMRRLKGYAGMEVYNASGWAGAGSPCATGKWDMLLSEGRRLWGFGSDDYHGPAAAGRAWNVACVHERTAESVLDALRCGRFYASTGVTIDRIEADGPFARVEAAGARRILAVSDYGKLAAFADGPWLELCVPDEATYIRFECWGAGQQCAWTQPFFVTSD